MNKTCKSIRIIQSCSIFNLPTIFSFSNRFSHERHAQQTTENSSICSTSWINWLHYNWLQCTLTYKFALSINIIDNLFTPFVPIASIIANDLILSFFCFLFFFSLVFNYSFLALSLSIYPSHVRNEIETITKPLSNFNQSNQTSETLLMLVQC